MFTFVIPPFPVESDGPGQVVGLAGTKVLWFSNSGQALGQLGPRPRVD